MMYPFGLPSKMTVTEFWLLRKARDEYRVILKLMKVQRRETYDRKRLKGDTCRETDFRSRNLGRELHNAPRL